MSAIVKSEMISRRKALSLMGLAAAFGLAAAPTVLAVSDAEAQTVGLGRPLAGCEGNATRDESDHKQQSNRPDVCRVVDGERVARLSKEEIEG